MSLIHLIYASAATSLQNARQLDAILAASRKNNGRSGVTGMLLYSEGSFFQILEGDEAAVDATFARIHQDSRHTQTTCIIREPIASRTFREWTMGHTTVTNEQIAQLIGFNDFFRDGNCLHDLDAGRARKLLTAFAAGRWRTRLHEPVGV